MRLLDNITTIVGIWMLALIVGWAIMSCTDSAESAPTPPPLNQCIFVETTAKTDMQEYYAVNCDNEFTEGDTLVVWGLVTNADWDEFRERLDEAY